MKLESAPERREWAAAHWVALYLTLGLSVALTQPDHGQAGWYPAVGVGMALLILRGVRLWPFVLLAEVVISLVQYHDLTGGLVSAVCTTGEVALAAFVLRRLRFRPTFERVEDVALMAMVTSMAGLLAATAGAGLLQLTHSSPLGFGSDWKVWAAGDVTGSALCLPMLLLSGGTRGAARRLIARVPRRSVEVIGVTSLSAGILVAYFLTFRVHDLSVAKVGPFTLCLFPLAWIAVRFGLVRTAVVVFLLDAVAVFSYTGLAPLLVEKGERPDNLDLVGLQLPVYAFGIVAVGVAAAIEGLQRSRTRESFILDASPIAIVALDDDGIVTSWNRAAEAIFGFSAEEAIGRRAPMVRVDDEERFEQQRQVYEEQARYVDYQHKDGSIVAVRAFTAPLLGADGRWGGVGIIEDITTQRQSRERQDLLNAAFAQAGESILITTPEPTIIYANPAALASSGYSLDEVLGQHPRMFKSDQQDRPFYERMWTVLLAGQRWEGVLVNKRKDGSLYEERCAIGPVYDANGTLIAYVSVKHDLTHQRLLEANLQRSLRIRGTALMVMEGIERQATAAATATTLCESIVQVSGTEAMVVQVRADGSIAVIGVHGAALGGMADVIVPAEFAATYVAATEQSSWVSVHDQPREPDSPSAIYLASKGFTATAQSAIRSEGRLVGILSLATRAEDGAEWMEDHLALADELGSFASVLLGSQIDAEVRAERSRVEIEAMIAAHHRFHTVFQPYVDLITREVKGYEALTRFDDGTRPDVLITAAWAVGVGAEVEIACARAALDVANQVMPGVPISLNFSPQTILRGDVADVVTRSDEPLVIEVTEHTEISDYPALRDALQRCGQIKVSVDDAGAGFASMRHILELHPDVVKLDIGLIRGIDVDLGRQALAAGLCHYAAQTGTLLIAEGIETAEEAEMARTLGVHYGQGYFFGRPARVD